MSEDIFTAYRVDHEGSWWFHDGRALQDSLKAGFYMVDTDPWGQIFLRPRHRISDEIIPLPNSNADTVLNLTKKFIRGEFKDSLEAIGMVNKMSILMWGLPGTSKSVTIFQLIDYAIENNWVIIDGAHELDELATAIRHIRMIEPDRGVMVIWEEFDSILRRHEEDVLQLLDGKDQIPNTLYLMTTNFIDRIPSRILGRTRRVSYQVMFTYPDEAERRAYFQGKVPGELLEKVDLEAWVAATEGYSIDNCAQVVIGVLAYGMSLEEVVTDLSLRAQLSAADEEDEDEDFYHMPTGVDDEDDYE